MGLGKTVQAITFLLHVGSLPGIIKRFLIIVPSSTIGNWKKEIVKWAPHYKICVYQGSQKERASLQETYNDKNSFHIMLTTMVLFDKDSNTDDRTFLRSFKYEYLVIDEAHNLKNVNSNRFERLMKLKTNHKILLTGTPVQNNLGELLALLCFTFPDIFSNENQALLHLFDGRKEKSAVESRQMERVRRMLLPFIMRRLKTDVLGELVNKETIVKKLPLQEDQKVIYDDIITEWKKMKSAIKTGKPSPKLITSVFTDLRKAANHPLLLNNLFKPDIAVVAKCLHQANAFGSQTTALKVQAEISTYSDFDLNGLCLEYMHKVPKLGNFILPETTLFNSTKMLELQDMLPKLVAKGHRILLFSQWTSLLDIFEVLLNTLDLKFLRLDGSISVSERQALIDLFTEDMSYSVFLLSTRAGGLGINLAAADTGELKVCVNDSIISL